MVVTMVLTRTVWVFVLVGVTMLVAMAMSVVVSMFVMTGINAYRCFSGQTASAFFTH